MYYCDVERDWPQVGDEPAGDWATSHDSVHDVLGNKKSNALFVFILFSTEENLVPFLCCCFAKDLPSHVRESKHIPDRANCGKGSVRIIAVQAYQGSMKLLFVFIFPTPLTRCCCFRTLNCVAKLVTIKTSQQVQDQQIHLRLQVTNFDFLQHVSSLWIAVFQWREVFVSLASYHMLPRPSTTCYLDPQRHATLAL